ncbi:unnamed protein product [Nezara viridula]|uniref:Ig-like domain-containing protein n=1 Tax=Nezara viridula TaxID=85310 RepID=A0A9P0HLA0_NEZVI|nr:unnamed protein product [Nezara viridula]
MPLISCLAKCPRALFFPLGPCSSVYGCYDNRAVSWVRHRDIHLLTVGRYTYTSDQRFEAIHLPHTEDWSLRIRYPQRKDSGIYECQISTTPPIGHPVYLTVVGECVLLYYNINRS